MYPRYKLQIRDCYRCLISPFNYIFPCALSAVLKSKNIYSQNVNRKRVESSLILSVINYVQSLLLAAVTSSCLTLRNRDDLFTCAEKCKLHSGDDNFHEQTAQTRARGEVCSSYKPAISVFRTLGSYK